MMLLAYIANYEHGGGAFMVPGWEEQMGSYGEMLMMGNTSSYQEEVGGGGGGPWEGAMEGAQLPPTTTPAYRLIWANN